MGSLQLHSVCTYQQLDLGREKQRVSAIAGVTDLVISSHHSYCDFNKNCTCLWLRSFNSYYRIVFQSSFLSQRHQWPSGNTTWKPSTGLNTAGELLLALIFPYYLHLGFIVYPASPPWHTCLQYMCAHCTWQEEGTLWHFSNDNITWRNNLRKQYEERIFTFAEGASVNLMKSLLGPATGLNE